MIKKLEQQIVRLRDGYHVCNRVFKDFVHAQEYLITMTDVIKTRDTKLQHIASENGKTIEGLQKDNNKVKKALVSLREDLCFAQQACQKLVEENTHLKARLGLEQTITVQRRKLCE